MRLRPRDRFDALKVAAALVSSCRFMPFVSICDMLYMSGGQRAYCSGNQCMCGAAGGTQVLGIRNVHLMMPNHAVVESVQKEGYLFGQTVPSLLNDSYRQKARQKIGLGCPGNLQCDLSTNQSEVWQGVLPCGGGDINRALVGLVVRRSLVQMVR